MVETARGEISREHIPRLTDAELAAQWRLARGQQMRHYRWDDEFVLFNNLSGDTHLLGLQAMQLLQALAPGARSEAELGAALTTSFPGDTSLSEILIDLERLMLVERCPC